MAFDQASLTPRPSPIPRTRARARILLSTTVKMSPVSVKCHRDLLVTRACIRTKRGRSCDSTKSKSRSGHPPEANLTTWLAPCAQ